MKEKEYVIYKENDELVFLGNSRECSNFLECSIDSFYCRLSRFQRGIIKRPEYEIYLIEDDEDF